MTAIETLKEYFSYEGRLNRKSCFLRYTGVTVALIIFMIIGVMIGINRENVAEMFSVTFTLVFYLIFMLTFMLTYIVFMLFQAIKRLHDLNKSGWYLLILLGIIVPLIGKFIVLAFGLYLLLVKGTAGPNRFGPDPLEKKFG